MERVVEYLEVPQEAPAVTSVKPPAYWPASGDLRVDHLNAKYSDNGPLVLKDVNFELKSGECVGVGASSSTMLCCSFNDE